MKLFLDTNILIDYLSRRKPFFKEAVQLRVASLIGDIELWCSIQSFIDAEYILRDALPIDVLRSMMEKSLRFINVASSPSDELLPGFESGWPDLEDYLIATCASRVRADYLITRDSEGFKSSRIPAISPKEFFAVMEAKFGITYEEIDL